MGARARHVQGLGARKGRRLIAAVPTILIDDPADGRLDDYRNVPDPELIERRGIFVAEGRLVVERLLCSSRFRARSLMVTEAARLALAEHVARRPELPVFVVPQAVMNGIAGLNIHRGCLAIGDRPPAVRWQDVVVRAVRLVVLEQIGNADNIGSLFRNAAAFGVDAVLLGPSCTDPLYRKAIRTSMGAALLLPFARVDEWPGVLATLGAMGFSLIALTPRAEAETIHQIAADVRGKKVALVLGHEGHGLSADAIAACDHRARIPMAPGMDSLNVATAGAVAMYELAVGS
jgi:tRNA G18 (ribose-2'-O)-methylase SpoU